MEVFGSSLDCTGSFGVFFLGVDQSYSCFVLTFLLIADHIYFFYSLGAIYSYFYSKEFLFFIHGIFFPYYSVAYFIFLCSAINAAKGFTFSKVFFS
jgi:hypothetical protein